MAVSPASRLHALASRSLNRRCFFDAQGRRVCEGLPTGAIIAMVLAAVIILPLCIVLFCRSRIALCCGARRQAGARQGLTGRRGSERSDGDGCESAWASQQVISYPISAASADGHAAPPPYAAPPPRSGASHSSFSPPSPPAPVLRGWPAGLLAASTRPVPPPSVSQHRRTSSTAKSSRRGSAVPSTSAAAPAAASPRSPTSASLAHMPRSLASHSPPLEAQRPLEHSLPFSDCDPLPPPERAADAPARRAQ